MCFPLGEFRIGSSDVLLGTIGRPGPGGPGSNGSGGVAAPFHMSGPQFDYWKHTHLTLDVVPGRGAGFSLEAPEGVRFMIRSRLFTDAEEAELEPVVIGNGEA